MKLISVKELPEYKDIAVQYIQDKWANKNSLLVYENCIANCVESSSPLPQWYLLMEASDVVGCAGLITKRRLKGAVTVQNLELSYKVALKRTLTVQNLELFIVFGKYFKTAPTSAQNTAILPD